MKRLKKLNTLAAELSYAQIDTPLGQLTLLATQQGLHTLLWESEAQTETGKALLQNINKDSNHRVLIKARLQLQAYFNRQRQIFDLPLDLDGTAFQKKAWRVLSNIPYGETMTYGEQARLLGDINKARAVGLANGLNPLPIIIPCHRVIGTGGRLTGFGGGLENKRLLLSLESRQDSLVDALVGVDSSSKSSS